MRYSCLFNKMCLVFVLSLMFCVNDSFAQQSENYSRAKIFLDTNGRDMFHLSALGVAVDHGDYRKGKSFTSDFSERELKQISDAGFKVEILIQDVKKFYQEQNDLPSANKMSSVPCDTADMTPVKVPARFHLGSYAGYFTYNEMLQILDSMTLLYPNLISARAPVSTFKTIENRSIYWLRISNNPTVNQSAKPQVFYNALHHAREPGSLSATIFYMWYLLENYATDPKVKAIVDNSELYFIPCVNPDGYIYNNINSPNGGGMWRKNRRLNLDFTYGVDLNRNYGLNYAFDNIGSSGVPSSETYRGTGAFSEPETQAVKWFTENHNFSLSLNFHTFNNEMLYPWSHVKVAYTPDSLEFSAYSFFLANDNFYRYGTCYQCLGYVSNGGSDDWMYGEQVTKNKIFAWTPEIGEVQYGFYPPIYKILPDCKANLMTNLNTAALLLPYAKITTADPNILTSASGYLHYDIQRLGLGSGTYTVTAQALDNWISISPGSKMYSNLNSLQVLTDSISYTLDANTPNNTAVRYVLTVNNGFYDVTDTVQFFYGKYHSDYTPATNSLASWNNSGWSINTSRYHSAPSSVKSSPTAGSYPNNSNLTLFLKDVIDLTAVKRAYLQFYTWWDIEPKYDYVTVSVAPVMTNNWTSLCGRHTKPGDYNQPLSAPVYDDHQYDWILEQMDLTPFAGQKVNIQFELVSDAAENYDGFYFDDLQITTVLDSALNVSNISSAAGLAIYPNPADDKVTIDLKSTELKNARVAFYDCLGRLVKGYELNKPITVLDINELTSNIYYLKIYNDQYSLPVQKLQLRR